MKLALTILLLICVSKASYNAAAIDNPRDNYTGAASVPESFHGGMSFMWFPPTEHGRMSVMPSPTTAPQPPTGTPTQPQPPARIYPEPTGDSGVSRPSGYPEGIETWRGYGNVGEQIAAIVCQLEFTWPCNEAVAVAYCEMGGIWQPWAVNPIPIYNAGVENHASGLFQLALPLHQGLLDGAFDDPTINARAAHKLYSKSGWSAWACRPY